MQIIVSAHIQGKPYRNIRADYVGAMAEAKHIADTAKVDVQVYIGNRLTTVISPNR